MTRSEDGPSLECKRSGPATNPVYRTPEGSQNTQD